MVFTCGWCMVDLHRLCLSFPKGQLVLMSVMPLEHCCSVLPFAQVLAYSTVLLK